MVFGVHLWATLQTCFVFTQHSEISLQLWLLQCVGITCKPRTKEGCLRNGFGGIVSGGSMAHTLCCQRWQRLLYPRMGHRHLLSCAPNSLNDGGSGMVAKNRDGRYKLGAVATNWCRSLKTGNGRQKPGMVAKNREWSPKTGNGRQKPGMVAKNRELVKGYCRDPSPSPGSRHTLPGATCP